MREGFWGSWRDPFAQSHQNSQRYKLLKSHALPLPCRKGGRGDRSHFHGVIHSRKAIKTDRDTNLQTAIRSPFLVGKGPGDRSMAVDVKDTADGNAEAAVGM